MPKKTYLKSAVYVLLLPAVCVTSFALAQRNSNKSSSDLERSKRPSLSDLGGSGQVMRIQSVPVSQPPTWGGGPFGVTTPTPTPTPGPCQFHVLIVYADPKPPTQLQSEIQAEPNVVAVDVFDASVGIPLWVSCSNTTSLCLSAILCSSTPAHLAAIWRTTWTAAG